MTINIMKKRKCNSETSIHMLNGTTLNIPIDEKTDIQTIREAASSLLNVPVGRIQLFHGSELLSTGYTWPGEFHVVCSGIGTLVVVPWFHAPFQLDTVSGTRYALADVGAERFCAGRRCVYLWEKTIVRQVLVVSGRTLRTLRIGGNVRALHWLNGILYVARGCTVDAHNLPEPDDSGQSTLQEGGSEPSHVRDGVADVRTQAELDATIDSDQLIRIFMAQDQPLVTRRRGMPRGLRREDSMDTSQCKAEEPVSGDRQCDVSVGKDSDNDCDSAKWAVEDDVSPSRICHEDDKSWARPECKRRRESADMSSIVSDVEVGYNSDAKLDRMPSTDAGFDEQDETHASEQTMTQTCEGSAGDGEMTARVTVASDNDEHGYACVDNEDAPSHTFQGCEEDVCVECLCATESTIYVGYRSGRVKKFSLQTHEAMETFVGSALGSLRAVSTFTGLEKTEGDNSQSPVVCFMSGDSEVNLTVRHSEVSTGRQVMPRCWTCCMATSCVLGSGYMYFGTMNGRLGCYQLHPFEHLWTVDAERLIRCVTVSACGSFVYVGTDTEVAEMRASDGAFVRAWSEKRGVKGLCLIAP